MEAGSGNIKRNKRGDERYVSGSTLLPPTMERSSDTPHVATSAAARVHMTYEELSVENIARASTVTLLRERARDLRAVYVRMWRCFAGNKPTEFLYDSTEGDGGETSKMANLNSYIAVHVARVEQLRMELMRNAEAKKRWKKAQRSGGRLVREMRARSVAVVDELSKREHMGLLPGAVVVTVASTSRATVVPQVTQLPDRDVSPVASATGEVRAVAPPSASLVTLFPAQYAQDVRRIEREIEMEENGFMKPSVGDKLIAARTRAYERGDIDGVASANRQIAKRQNTKRMARQRKKQRKKVIAQCHREYEWRNRKPDPPSDGDNACV